MEKERQWHEVLLFSYPFWVSSWKTICQDIFRNPEKIKKKKKKKNEKMKIKIKINIVNEWDFTSPNHLFRTDERLFPKLKFNCDIFNSFYPQNAFFFPSGRMRI